MDYIYGKLNEHLAYVRYNGEETTTATTTVNNSTNKISVDVKKVPYQLTISNNSGTIETFDGSASKTLTFRLVGKQTPDPGDLATFSLYINESSVGDVHVPIGTIPQKTSDLTNDGEGTGSPFATQSYVDFREGKIDKINLNGVEQSIVNKAVSLVITKSTVVLDQVDNVRQFSPINLNFNDTTVPSMDGTGAVGFSTYYSRADHVHPHDSTKANDTSVLHINGNENINGLKTITAYGGLKVANLDNGIQNSLGHVIQMPSTSGTFALTSDIHNIPSGGSLNQVLTKTSNSDYSVAWKNVSETSVTSLGGASGAITVSGALSVTNNNLTTSAEANTIVGVKNSIGNPVPIDENRNVQITKAVVGLGNVVNTGDSSTPVNGGTTKFTTGGAYTELNKKVDKVTGYSLTKNNFTDELLGKLNGIETGAEVNVQSDWNQTDTTADDYIKNKPVFSTVATSGSFNDLTNKPTIDSAIDIESTNAIQNQAVASIISANASTTNKLTDKAYVDGLVASSVARYLTSDVSGNPFPTNASIMSATTFYYAGVVVIPSQGDFAIVTADETKSGKTTRYMYSSIGTSSLWQFQFVLNDTTFTQAQIDAMNSGVTATKVSQYDSHILSTSNPHSVTKSQVGLGNVDNVQQYSASNPNLSNILPLQDETTARVGTSTLYARADHVHPVSTIGHGVPAGGTTGQVLKKHSDTDYDVEWGTGGGSGGVESIDNVTGAITLGQNLTMSGQQLQTLAQINVLEGVLDSDGEELTITDKKVTLTKSAVGLSNVDNTADNTKNVLSATKFTTARTINGVSFDGTENITTGVTGVKGEAESSYRLGDVTMTLANLGYELSTDTDINSLF